MKKNDKKTDNAIRSTLTDLCELAKDEFQGFEWLTHLVNYANFPNSLSVVCVFDTDENLKLTDKTQFASLIQKQLASIAIELKNINKHIHFDTEEKCRAQHGGNWNKRLQ